ASIRQVTRHVRLSWQAVPEVAVVKTNPGKLKNLSVGSRVFYPGHGVVSVASIEERELGGGVQKFYVLAIELDAGVKLFLPVDKVDQAGVRELVSASKARQLLRTMAAEVEPVEV